MAWNPIKWQWDNLDDQIQQVQIKGSIEEPWTCGNRKDLPIGSRVFLFKQGNKQKGIIGAGFTLTEPQEEPHYNTQLAVKGRAVKRVNVRWYLLEREPIIPLERLMLPPFSSRKWIFQASGYEIEKSISDALLTELSNLSKRKIFCLPEEETIHLGYHEGTVCSILINKYERNLQAREKCIEHWGTRCIVCGFDFGLTFGKFAVGFIHVHHIKPLYEIKSDYKVDPVHDLRPVCPNCHAVLHMRKPPMSIEELKLIINTE
ncbi:HNH endonuclease [Desulfobacter latus]|nr:HNH endonuclease [Desulfobacter latus]